jgi:hypothetical protein
VTLPPTDTGGTPADNRRSENATLMLLVLIGLAAFGVVALRASWSARR